MCVEHPMRLKVTGGCYRRDAKGCVVLRVGGDRAGTLWKGWAELLRPGQGGRRPWEAQGHPESCHFLSTAMHATGMATLSPHTAHGLGGIFIPTLQRRKWKSGRLGGMSA